MTIGRSILLTTACCLVLSGIGGLSGLILAVAAPDYYRAVFPGMDELTDWKSVGIALGATQGGIAGLVFGLVLTGIFVWRETKLESIRGGTTADK